jgi:hypothetical protein
VPGRRDQPVDLVHGVVRGQPGLRGGHLRVGVYEPVPGPVGHRVMHPQAALHRPVRDRPADTDHRDVLCVGAGHPVDRAQRAHRVGHDQRGHAVQPRVAVRRVGRVQLVTRAYPLQRPGVLHLLKQLKVVVTRHPERMPDPGLPDTPEQEVPHGHRQALRVRSHMPGLSCSALSRRRHSFPPEARYSRFAGLPAVY